MSVYGRTADVVAARLNFSIVSVSNLSPPTKDPEVNLEGYWQAIDWLLDFHSAGIPASSSIVAFFWNGREQLSNPYWAPELEGVFRSILAYPTWMFNPNNFGNVNLSARSIVDTLPREFYTVASIAQPFSKIQVNAAAFIAFVLCEGMPIWFIWCILAWLLITQPGVIGTSSFPLMDLFLKTSLGSGTAQACQSGPSGVGVSAMGDRAMIQCAVAMPRIAVVGEAITDNSSHSYGTSNESQAEQRSDATTEVELEVQHADGRTGDAHVVNQESTHAADSPTGRTNSMPGVTAGVSSNGSADNA